MLVKGYPFEMQGRLAEALELCETAVESARLADNPHYLFWALFELGFAHYYLGDLDAVIAACEESARVGGRMVGGTMPAGGGGPAWVLASALFELGDLDRGFADLPSSGGEELAKAIPVERCYNFETLALAELARDRPEAAADYVAPRRGAGGHARTCTCPAALGHRARAALLLAAGDAAQRGAGGGAGRRGVPRPRARRLQAAFATSARGAGAGRRGRAGARPCRSLREAEHELDGCGSHRVRDACGASCASSAPAPRRAARRPRRTPAWGR